MKIYKVVYLIAFSLSLSACLKVTGEAKDPFDLEDEEVGRFNIGGLVAAGTQSSVDDAGANTDRSPSATDVKAPRTAGVIHPDAEAVDEQLALPISVDPTVQQDSQLQRDASAFERWKEVKSQGEPRDTRYQEYLEFKEYQEWLRFKETQQHLQ